MPHYRCQNCGQVNWMPFKGAEPCAKCGTQYKPALVKRGTGSGVNPNTVDLPSGRMLTEGTTHDVPALHPANVTFMAKLRAVSRTNCSSSLSSNPM